MTDNRMPAAERQRENRNRTATSSRLSLRITGRLDTVDADGDALAELRDLIECLPQRPAVRGGGGATRLGRSGSIG